MLWVLGTLQLFLTLTGPPQPLMECRDSNSSSPGWQSQSRAIHLSCPALRTFIDVCTHDNAILLRCQILYLPILYLPDDYLKGNTHMPRKLTITVSNNIYSKSIPPKGPFK